MSRAAWRSAFPLVSLDSQFCWILFRHDIDHKLLHQRLARNVSLEASCHVGSIKKNGGLIELHSPG